MVNIIIYDKNKELLNQIVSLMMEFVSNTRLKIELDTCSSIEELFISISDSKYNITMIGIEITKDIEDQIKKIDRNITIFNYNQIIDFESYDIFSMEEKRNFLDGVQTFINQKIYRIYTIRRNNDIFHINLNEVLYFYFEKKRVDVVYMNRIEEINCIKIDEVEKELTEIKTNFVRVSEKHLVNFYLAKCFFGDKIVMNNNEEISISPKYMENIKMLLCKNSY